MIHPRDIEDRTREESELPEMPALTLTMEQAAIIALCGRVERLERIIETLLRERPIT